MHQFTLALLIGIFAPAVVVFPQSLKGELSELNREYAASTEAWQNHLNTW